MKQCKTRDRITQVMLEHRYDTSSMSIEVAWIRSDLAKVGKRVAIENDPSVWTVIEVYGTKEVSDLEGQYKAWREFRDKLGG